MRRSNISWKICAVLIMVFIGLSISIVIAFADTETAESRITLDIKDVAVKSAIETLFLNTGKNYSIDQSVQGTISALSFKDVTFDSALKTLCKTNSLVYRVDGGVYIITKRTDYSPDIRPASIASSPASIEPGSGSDTTKASEMIIDRIPLYYSSASEILSILGNGGRQYGGSGFANMGPYGIGGYNSSGLSSGGNYGGYGGYNGYGGYGGYSDYNSRGYRSYGTSRYGSYRSW